MLAVVLSLALMVLDHRFAHLQQAREALAFFTYPLNYLADLPVTFSRWFGEISATRGTLHEENALLKYENLKLKAQMQKYDTLQAENLRLRDLLDASYKIGERVLIAELSSVDLDPFKQQVMINKGSNSGAYLGQAVLDAEAVMGQVTQVTPFSATVLLITDPSHAIPIRVARNGLRTIAIGSGKIDALNLPYLPTNSDIRVGDQLVTSGLGGKFPAGYPVARVTKINRSPDNAFAEISAEPTAHLDRSREVLLVWSVDPLLNEPTTVTPQGEAETEAEAEAGNAAPQPATEATQ